MLSAREFFDSHDSLIRRDFRAIEKLPYSVVEEIFKFAEWYADKYCYERRKNREKSVSC